MSLPAYLGSKREHDLFVFLRPYLSNIGINTVLDYMCGYSPLAPYILSMRKISLHGFDCDVDAIESLRRALPGGKWSVCRDSDYHVPAWPPIPVIMWLGVDVDERPGKSCVAEHFVRVVGEADPMYLFIELATRYLPGQKVLERVRDLVAGDYLLVDQGATRVFVSGPWLDFPYNDREFFMYVKIGGDQGASTSAG